MIHACILWPLDTAPKGTPFVMVCGASITDDDLEADRADFVGTGLGGPPLTSEQWARVDCPMCQEIRRNGEAARSGST